MDSLLRIVSTTSWKLFLFGNFVIFFSHALCETGQQLSNNFLICRNFVCQPVSRVLINFNKLMTFWICSSGRLSLPRYKFERWNKLSVYSDWALIVSFPQNVFTPLIKIQLSSIQKAFGYWKHALFSFLKESFWDTVCKCVNQTKCFPLWVDFSSIRSQQKKQKTAPQCLASNKFCFKKLWYTKCSKAVLITITQQPDTLLAWALHCSSLKMISPCLRYPQVKTWFWCLCPP